MRRRALLAALLCVPMAAMAAPKEELAQTKEAIKAAEMQQAKLAAQISDVERDLGNLQEKLVKSAESLQQSTAQAADAQARLKALEKEQAAKQIAYENGRKKLDGLSRIAIRLSRTPPQAMVLMPSDGKNRIQAAHALSTITAEIKTQSELIQQEMQQLDALKTKVDSDRRKFEKIRDAVREEKKNYEAQLKSRRQLRDKLGALRQEGETKIAALAKKATSLQDLIATLEKEAKKPKKTTRGQMVISEEGVAGSRGRLRDFDGAKGRIRIPVGGRVVSNYGDAGTANDTLKGVKIEAASAAPVIAPFDAEVAYTGTFLNYGKLVILKHRSGKGGNYHTLLAGLERIDVENGDFLLEGEPIGAMGNDTAQQLYVELRANNQPMNPKGWMRGL